jgi:hypothetical protein
MKKSIPILVTFAVFTLSVILACSLSGPTALAGVTAPGAAATGWNVSDLIGTWGTTGGNPYIELTFTPGGKLYVTSPSEDQFWLECAYAIKGFTFTVAFDNEMEEYEMQLSKDSLRFDGKGAEAVLQRKPGPLVRTADVKYPMDPPAGIAGEAHGENKAETSADSPALDPAVLGTWGGLQKGYYVEWTFLADGSFIRFLPQDDSLTQRGVFQASDGVMLFADTDGKKMITAYYETHDDIIGLYFNDADNYGYYRKDGPLIRIVGSVDSPNP